MTCLLQNPDCFNSGKLEILFFNPRQSAQECWFSAICLLCLSLSPCVCVCLCVCLCESANSFFLVSLHQSGGLLLIAYLRRPAVRVCRNIINMVINIIVITKVIIINITINAIIIFVVTMSYDCLFETGSRQSVPQDRINCS